MTSTNVLGLAPGKWVPLNEETPPHGWQGEVLTGDGQKRVFWYSSGVWNTADTKVDGPILAPTHWFKRERTDETF